MMDNAIVVSHTLQGSPEEQIYKMTLKTPIALSAKPGQFVHVKVGAGIDPLLRRPLSISAIDREREQITLFYRVKGEGTSRLTQVKPQEHINLMGPLGTGFSLPQAGEELWLVAGGIGSFPLYALAKEALDRGVSVRLYWGGEKRSFIESAGLKEWSDLGIEPILTSMDGSVGEKGLITVPLLRDLKDLNNTNEVGNLHSQKELAVATCGPTPMLKALAELCSEQGIPCEVSLEERMACGVGACLGCSCLLQDADGNLKRGRVCKDGPVFSGSEVIWDEFK